MPHMVNGTGTTYYGKKDAVQQLCTNHGVVKLKTWEDKKAEALEEAWAQHEQHPDDGQAAMGLLGTFLGFQDVDGWVSGNRQSPGSAAGHGRGSRVE